MSVTEKQEIIQGGPVPLLESQGKDGAIKILIISPGWGSCGYYSQEMLERAAPRYVAGTQMFWDHPRKDDERNRPERSLRDLAAILTEAGHYEANGPRGPGIYAQARVRKAFREAVEELSQDIGISHYVAGISEEGEAEGRTGPIIKEITAVRSVDFVTLPGRGGQILEAFREARPPEEQPLEQNQNQSGNMTTAPPKLTLESLRTEHPEIIEALRAEYEDSASLKEAQAKQEKALKEAKKKADDLEKENARLKEAQTLIAAKAFVESKVKESKIPDITKARIVESLSQAPALKEDGGIDETKYDSQIQEVIKAEADYIAKLTGGGKVTGMGGSAGPEGGTLEESEKGLAERLKKFGGI